MRSSTVLECLLKKEGKIMKKYWVPILNKIVKHIQNQDIHITINCKTLRHYEKENN